MLKFLIFISESYESYRMIRINTIRGIRSHSRRFVSYYFRVSSNHSRFPEFLVDGVPNFRKFPVFKSDENCRTKNRRDKSSKRPLQQYSEKCRGIEKLRKDTE